MVAWIGNLPEISEFGQFAPRVYLYDTATGRLQTVPAEVPPEVFQMFIGTAVLGDGLLAWTWQEAGIDHLTVYDPATGKTVDFGGETAVSGQDRRSVGGPGGVAAVRLA